MKKKQKHNARKLLTIQNSILRNNKGPEGSTNKKRARAFFASSNKRRLVLLVVNEIEGFLS